MSNYTGKTSFEDQVTGYQSEMETQFGADFMTGSASNNYRLMYPIFSELLVRYNKLENWLNQRDIYKASGIYLDRLLGNWNFIRKQNSKSQVYWVTEDSTPLTKVEIGDLQVEDSSSRVFENISSGVVDEDGKMTILMRSIETGEDYNVTVRTLNSIVTPVAGISTGTNTKAAKGGQDKETDYEYRIRFLASYSGSESWTLASIQTKILAVDGVKSAKVFENDTTETNAAGIPQKSVMCVVDGGISSDIAQAIYEKTNPAIYIQGDVEETVIDARGEEVIIRFFRPEEIEVEYLITVVPETYDTIDIETQVENYISDSVINDALKNYEVTKDYINVNITDTELSKLDELTIKFRRKSVGGSYYSTLQMSENEKGVVA